MSLQTRVNEKTGEVEVLVDGEWLLFTSFREKQIDEAYDKSVKFLRDRLGEEYTQEESNSQESIEESDGNSK